VVTIVAFHADECRGRMPVVSGAGPKQCPADVRSGYKRTGAGAARSHDTKFLTCSAVDLFLYRVALGPVCVGQGRM
jgi:hypothetical protein